MSGPSDLPGPPAPMSEAALRGLAAAVQWNPGGAKLLLDILNTAQECVKHKPDDAYGPLGMMLHGQGWPHAATGAAFPPELLPSCEAFGREWIEPRCSKRELAAVLKVLLGRLGVPPVKAQAGGWSATRSAPDTEPDPMARYFRAV